jgi:hypothetical protein
MHEPLKPRWEIPRMTRKDWSCNYVVKKKRKTKITFASIISPFGVESFGVSECAVRKAGDAITRLVANTSLCAKHMYSSNPADTQLESIG